MMKSKTIRILITSYMVLVMMLNITTYVLAEDPAQNTDYDFWEAASKWFSTDQKDAGEIVLLPEGIMKQLTTIVEVVGTGVIAIATVVLGIRYMLGSVSEKTQAKEGMLTLLVACVFFFGWSNLRKVLFDGISFDDNGTVTEIGGASTVLFFQGATTLENALSVIFAIVLFIAKIVAVGVSVYMGVKYIFSGAEQKAKFKEKSVNYIIGIILIFLTLQILTFISESINNAFVVKT